MDAMLLVEIERDQVAQAGLARKASVHHTLRRQDADRVRQGRCGTSRLRRGSRHSEYTTPNVVVLAVSSVGSALLSVGVSDIRLSPGERIADIAEQQHGLDDVSPMLGARMSWEVDPRNRSDSIG